jgi:solute carrier family 12 sodium/potassium/chloride transporter 2
LKAHAYRSALTNLLKLSGASLHVKNYRPQILVLTGNPIHRPRLLQFSQSVTKGDSLLVCAHVVPVSQLHLEHLFFC